jgi:flagellar motor protein MotB
MRNRLEAFIFVLRGGLLPALAAAGLLALGTGCSASRAVDRGKVLEAENINLRQKSQTLESQMRQAHMAQDEAVAREQQLRAELLAAEQDARAASDARAQAAAARERVAGMQDDLVRYEAALAEATRKYEELIRQRTPPQPARPATARSGEPRPLRYGGTSPQTEAMRNDLQDHLARYGVNDLPVEIRRDQGGQERVAIVLPDAFPPGKATLAYNANAVKAVISVGKMISETYPKSAVLVEGHTDSDPIRKSGWGTNEKLSEARAAAVQTLLTNSGVSPTVVRTEGHGARQPLAQGATTRAKSRNRRVEIFISPGN